MANSVAPSLTTKRKFRVGNPGAGKKAPYLVDFDTSKERRILGLKYRTMEEEAKDLFEDFEKKGW